MTLQRDKNNEYINDFKAFLPGWENVPYFIIKFFTKAIIDIQGEESKS